MSEPAKKVSVVKEGDQTFILTDEGTDDELLIGEVFKDKTEMDMPCDVGLDLILESMTAVTKPVIWKAVKMPSPKKKAKSADKPVAKKKQAPASVEPEKLKTPDSLKDPEYVKALHDSDWPKFCKTYGVPEDTEKQEVASILARDGRDSRYKALTSTILTKKHYSHPKQYNFPTNG